VRGLPACFRCGKQPCECEDGITLYHGDSRELMPLFDDGSVDMILTDPPYGVEYGGGFGSPREKLTNDNVDVYQWAVPEFFRICNGPCYIWYGCIRSYFIFRAVHQANGVVHSVIIWKKQMTGCLRSQYKHVYESLVYCNGPKTTTKWCGPRNEVTLWELQRPSSNKMHPTEKPIALLRRAIRNHDVGLVFDPFAGAGSTGRACKDLGRRCIMIEVEKEYCEIAADRLGICEKVVESKKGLFL